jgi:hypothetical protein
MGSQAHRRIGDTRQQHNGASEPAHNKAIQSIMGSKAADSACENASRSTTVLIGKGLVRGKDANERQSNSSVHEDLDLSDSDSEDDLTDLTDIRRQNGIYQRAADMFPDVYGDRSRNSSTSIVFAFRSF